jgi:hypothetical protein
MTIEEIIAALEKVSFEVPAAALNAAEEQADGITPLLREALDKAANDPQPLLEDHEYQLHIYAIYLLARFRDRSAYRPLAKLFNLPDEQALDLTGDVLIEDGPLLLASVCDGDVGPIKSIIENEAAVPLLRTSAIAALPLLYMWGERTREEVIAYYRSLFAGGLAKPGATTVWAGLVTCCGHLQAQELAAEVRQAYVDGLILADALPYPEIEAALVGMRPQMVERFIRRYRPIEQTATAIAWWRCFNMKQDKGAPTPAADGNPYAGMHIGRNDPCPCGSGRKYKKCHGA